MKNILFLLSFIISPLLCLGQNSESKTLKELCELYPTDKCPDRHNFIEVYENLFYPFKDSFTRIFEIGILNGHSHLMWKDYFKNADVFGIDIKVNASLKDSGIHTFKGDQSNRGNLSSFIEKYGGEYDFILDDGGHSMDQQQISFGFLFKHVKSGGYYIIEDVHTSLPQYHIWGVYNVNEYESNTTLRMIEQYIRTSNILSLYITPEENEYLVNNIESVNLHSRISNGKPSIVCVIKKR